MKRWFLVEVDDPLHRLDDLPAGPEQWIRDRLIGHGPGIEVREVTEPATVENKRRPLL